MIETIYLARHGFRMSWENPVWPNYTGTPRDPPLAAHGVDQAKELAAWLAEQPDKPEAIFSSPLYRCLQTATPASEALNLPINVEHGISEWYLPVRRGLHPRSLPAGRLTQWFPLIDMSHQSLFYPTQKGETEDQVHERAEEVLRLLLGKLDREGGPKSVVLFSHAATGIAMGRALVGDREREVRSATCSVSKFRRVVGEETARDGLGEWERLLNGETSFLSRGEERHWDFSYVEAYEEDGVLEDGTELPTLSDNYKTVDPATSAGGKL
ncbi:phosphoglycerate mutase-like protein [Leucosporidium creatinivorum]|uniref:Phosphoglycerate mutase-like protein n=1 Tax=Leucosporidium creatinivorum TaxID=106004 RepID=A0A1Y2G3I8_9BASI|nr:phosphoglycerate mutase-like protein [Leucosporidium creatinivorum]